MARETETTPLLADSRGAVGSSSSSSLSSAASNTSTIGKEDGKANESWLGRLFNVENRILLAGFLITLAFSYTQVPLFYVFHLMECDYYYDHHPPYEGSGDRCSIDAITASTATQFSILGMSTTLCGTLNLFLTGWLIKKTGPRSALLQQTIVPAIRVATQIIGVMAGKRTGMIIIQATQLITIIGGPVGYILVVNIIAGEVVHPSRRTIVFGKLQGAIMLGQGIGVLAGGLIGEAIEIRAPFDIAFVSFLLAALYARTMLPYISPESLAGDAPARTGMAGFLAPLKILAPQRLRLPNGKIRKHYGVLFLTAGIFLGVLATGYVPLLIQVYATAAFEFDQGNNGWLMAEFAFVRGFFLIVLFPPIVAWGRKLMSKKEAAVQSDDTEGTAAMPKVVPDYGAVTAGGSATHSRESTIVVRDEADNESAGKVGDADETTDLLATDPAQFEATTGAQAEQEPVIPAKADNGPGGKESPEFDLVFLRWSLVVDGAMTTVAAFATKPWHIYLAAFLLPFGSGTAPAAKGVITEMCSGSQRADALNAVTLVENIARLATQGCFGFVFALLAEQGKAYATFYCNGAVAFLAMGVLLFSNFPPAGAEVIDAEEHEEEGVTEA